MVRQLDSMVFTGPFRLKYPSVWVVSCASPIRPVKVRPSDLLTGGCLRDGGKRQQSPKHYFCHWMKSLKALMPVKVANVQCRKAHILEYGNYLSRLTFPINTFILKIWFLPFACLFGVETWVGKFDLSPCAGVLLGSFSISIQAYDLLLHVRLPRNHSFEWMSYN